MPDPLYQRVYGERISLEVDAQQNELEALVVTTSMHEDGWDLQLTHLSRPTAGDDQQVKQVLQLTLARGLTAIRDVKEILTNAQEALTR